MDNIVDLSPDERTEIFVETAAKKGFSPGIVENEINSDS